MAGLKRTRAGQPLFAKFHELPGESRPLGKLRAQIDVPHQRAAVSLQESTNEVVVTEQYANLRD